MLTNINKFPGTPRTLGLAIMTLLATPLAIAADEGWYLGGAIGQTTADLNYSSAHRSVLPAGARYYGIHNDNHDEGFKVFGGYQFNSYFAIEGGYFDLGDYGFAANAAPSGFSSGNFAVDGWNLDLVGTLPLTAKLDLLGRAGFNYADTVTHLQGSGSIPASSPKIHETDDNFKLGVGLQYALTDNLDLRLEAERYHLDEPIKHKGNVDLVSLGLVYRFGAKPVARVAATPPPPAPVARVAPPAPTPAPTPTPTPAPVRVVFSADSLFDFDQSTVKPNGRQELDRFIADLNGVSYDLITVTGHTDRIGARAYNLNLSQRRADAVKSYLVQTGGLPAAKITARGVNGDDSVIAPNACTSTVVNDALKLCLQPDRRVEVEVTATR